MPTPTPIPSVPSNATVFAEGIGGFVSMVVEPISNSVLIVDFDQLHKISLDSGVETIIHVPNLSAPNGMAVEGGADTILVCEEVLGRLSRVDLATGALTPLATGLRDPWAVVIEEEGVSALVVEPNYGITRVDLQTGQLTPFKEALHWADIWDIAVT